MISNLLLIVLFVAAGSLFWQQRKQSESAQRLIHNRCEQLGLQLLSVSRGRYRWRSPEGQRGWFTQYHFEFSADGHDHYEGQCWLNGLRLIRFDLPAHRLPM
uniref:DUF3301 domain-containing protein n=1 Tax=Thaumasiovibrio occultus TaxID=1891184 RepID=UPI000B35C865|nr:DUF3301 domain-containing protein [Thaumasiovibrio occultus]